MRRTICTALILAGCAGPPPADEPDRPVAARLLPTATPLGLSGLTTDDRGNLWALPERDREIVSLSRVGDGVDLGARLELVGVPLPLETESITWLGGSLVAIGTERDRDRESDLVLIAQLDGGRFVVTDSLMLDYEPWGLVGIADEGIEGICAAGGYLFAAGEVVLHDGGLPFAPLGIFDLGSRTWTYERIALSSANGKIAGLDCGARADGQIHVVAIERHFDVRRVLAFEVGGSPPEVGPVAVAADITDQFSDNPEGIALSRGEWLLVTDNYFKGRRHGPGKLIALTEN